MSKATQQSTGGQRSTSTEPNVGSSETDAVSTDDVFELLSNQRRRFALHYLQHQDERIELGDLSEQVAAWETETPVREIDSRARKRVYTSLQSHHLPKMDEQGVVEYDDRAGTVELAASAEDLDVYLEVVAKRDIPWSQYYLGLGAVNAALVSVAMLGVWPFAVLPDLAWAAFVVTTMLVSATVHVYNDSVQRLGNREKPPELQEE